VTEVLNSDTLNREFSRKSFVKGGGAMIVGFSMAGAAVAKPANAAIDPYASLGPYDQGAVDSWIVVNADNTVTLKAGKVELGQGTSTGLMMIAAEELDVPMAQMLWTVHDTHVTPDQGTTSGSQGIQTGGLQVRAAAAAARDKLLDLAAASLGVAKASLTVTDGVVSGGGRSVTYGALLGGKLFNHRIPGSPTPTSEQLGTAARRAAGAPGTKPISQYKLVGTHHVPRIDLPDKISGKFVYTHNIRVPGALHGRIVRPRGQGAYGKGTAPEIRAVDESSIRGIPGAQVVRYENFLGVVAPTEYAAIQAAAQLKVTWAENPVLPGVGNWFKSWRDLDAAGRTPARIAVSNGNFDRAFAAAPIKLSATYRVHYQGSMAMGPECCVADVTPNGARIFSNTQNAYATRGLVQTALAEVMGSRAPKADRIRVTYYEGGSVFGPVAPYNDAAQAAAVMSALVGKPVRLQFMRWDSHAWGHYGPSLLADVRGAVDASGNLVAMEYTGFGHAGFSTHPTQQMITGQAQISTGNGALDGNISGIQYNIPNRRNIGKTVPLEDMAFKTAPLRAPNTVQGAFAYEQMVDELAYAVKMDPVAFRLKNVATPTGSTPDPSQRWRFALENVSKAANWQPRVAASSLSSANVVSGRGVAFGAFSNTRAAAVAEIDVNKTTGKILVRRVIYAADNGYVVYPDGLHNNEEGAIIQGVSRALHEQVNFNKAMVTSADWVTYPILRFVDAPKLHLVVQSRTDVPINDTGATVASSGARSTGGGEPGTVPLPAAIANAFFDATGVRIREMPMTPARIRGVLGTGRT
jgi:CO/xanthine dehydrogenase Mo-binding subunit